MKFPSPSVLYERLANVRVRAAANASMQVIDSLQSFAPEAQLAGLTSAFMLLAKHAGIAPSTLFTVCNNIMHAAEKKRPEFHAVEAYIQEEL